MKGEAIVVCAPTSGGAPAIPSRPRKCSECGQSVWLSANAGDVDDRSIMCLPCALPKIEEAGEHEVSAAPWVTKDSRRWSDDGLLMHDHSRLSVPAWE